MALTIAFKETVAGSNPAGRTYHTYIPFVYKDYMKTLS
ncbi:MAG: hypothetical protein JWQ54_3190 [Mucilaginibacter sp.]|nr:hypothetical protein [Mucilaginibacter sp.]